MRPTICLALLSLVLGAGSALAQRPTLVRRSLAGPRLGITFVSGSRAEQRLREHGLNPIMSQFGWHFEQQVSPKGEGPAFVIEEVLLVGAVEQQQFVPSASLIFGIRLPSGIEFGIGPNFTVVGPALAVAVGKTLNYGGVSLPINLAVVGSPGALRTSVLIGYAIQTSN